MRRDGGVSANRHFGRRRKIPNRNIVVVGARREDKGRLRVIEFAGYLLHLLRGQAIRRIHDPSRIACEERVRERVNLI